MGRPRKHDRHLPRGMLRRHGAYYFVARGKWLRLSKDYSEALIRYAELVGTDHPPIITIADALAQYIESGVLRLAPKTIEHYRVSAERLVRVFGHMHLPELEPAHVYRYLVECGNVAANRDRALLSAAYSHARRIGAFNAADPTKQLRYRNPEKPRDRYITDQELEAILAAASPKLRCIVQFIALTGMRQGDALRVRMADIDEEGVQYRQGKTGKRMLVLWSTALHDVVDDATTRWRRFGREWLFESRPRGKHAKRPIGPYTPSGVRALWRTACARAGVADAHLHDIRGKAGSDLATTADAQHLLGHADPKVTARHYRRKPDRVHPVR